ncbi:hypothetical protein [Mesorhizobium sp. CN2-181]|uniref:hypothetical protein n=1 Tax=Mesorhizobium yinganensis TaxID=3157707 RepID=UPI0032B7A0CA
MSMFIGLCRASSVEMLTDGASIDRDDRLAATKNKAIILPGCAGAISIRGNAKIIEMFEANTCKAFAAAGSFDIGLAALREGIPELADMPEGFPHFEALIGGMSETEGPQLAYFITKSDKPEIEACRLYVGRGLNANGIMRDENHRQVAILESNGGLAACGLHLAEGLRREKASLKFESNSRERYAIGGHLDLTVITAAGATTRRLHTWPDKVGEPINPFAGTNVTPLNPPMNRQQRRAAERLRREA